MNRFLEAAKQYLAAGLRPFPVQPMAKEPLCNWRKYADTPPTPEELERWWSETPTANVGLAMGNGTWVLDVDGPEGMDALRAAGINLDGYAHVSTGRGSHYYFQGDAPARIGVLPKVDTRVYGNYVVAPPSIHPSGGQYRGDVHPSSPPPALLSLVQRRQDKSTVPNTAAGDPVADWCAGVGEGGRDNACTRAAGKLLGLGLAPETVELLLMPGAERCDPPFPPDQVAKCVASIARRGGVIERDTPSSMAEIIAATLEEIDTPLAQRNVCSTGFRNLDRYLSGGFEPGEFIMLAARQGVGKTALALQIARANAARDRGVLVVTREMTPVKLARRLLVQMSQLRASDVRGGMLAPVQRDVLGAMAEELAASTLRIRRSPDVAAIAAAIEESDVPIKLVVIDYLQRLSGPPELRDSKRALVEHNSFALRDLALSLKVPVLCISSLRRIPKVKGQAQAPDADDLRDSGQLEFDADIVFIMDRPFGSDQCELHIKKNRDGREGVVPFTFDRERLTFKEAV